MDYYKRSIRTRRRTKELKILKASTRPALVGLRERSPPKRNYASSFIKPSLRGYACSLDVGSHLWQRSQGRRRASWRRSFPANSWLRHTPLYAATSLELPNVLFTAGHHGQLRKSSVSSWDSNEIKLITGGSIVSYSGGLCVTMGDVTVWLCDSMQVYTTNRDEYS